MLTGLSIANGSVPFLEVRPGPVCSEELQRDDWLPNERDGCILAGYCRFALAARKYDGHANCHEIVRHRGDHVVANPDVEDAALRLRTCLEESVTARQCGDRADDHSPAGFDFGANICGQDELIFDHQDPLPGQVRLVHTSPWQMENSDPPDQLLFPADWITKVQGGVILAIDRARMVAATERFGERRAFPAVTHPAFAGQDRSSYPSCVSGLRVGRHNLPTAAHGPCPAAQQCPASVPALSGALQGYRYQP